MFTIFLQKPDNLNREKTVVSKVGNFPSIRFCLTVVFPVMFPMNFRWISRRISTVYNHGMVLVFG